MKLTRRESIKLFGISAASLFMTRCKPVVSCYAPLPPTATATPLEPQQPQTVIKLDPLNPESTLTPIPLKFINPQGRLRELWGMFNELAEKTKAAQDTENLLGTTMIHEHRSALDQLVEAGEISASVAELVQEAYAAAVYHVYRSNALITCYEPMMVNYAPASAAVLVEQSAILADLAQQGNIDPGTLSNAQTALEHDLAFYYLDENQTQVLYDRIIQQIQAQGTGQPEFDQLELEVSPDAKAAALFIIELLTTQ
jgi:hypothetical protein